MHQNFKLTPPVIYKSIFKFKQLTYFLNFKSKALYCALAENHFLRDTVIFTILTLKGKERLSKYWKGKNVPADRKVISLVLDKFSSQNLSH